MKAWANVDESEIQALASLGELPETLRWIYSIGERLLNLIMMVKSKKYRMKTVTKIMNKHKGKSMLASDVLAEYWLEWRYAIRPLVFELEQARAALAKAARESRKTARGFDQATTQTSDTTYVNGVYRFSQTRTVQFTDNYRAGVLYTLESGFNPLASTWGLDQPLESIYELIPFSFILDWVFNFGDWIAAWTGNAGISPLSSWVMETHTRVEKIATYDWSVIPDDGSIVSSIVSSVPGESQCSITYKRRIPSPDRSLFPPFNLRLDGAKISDLMALGRKILLT